MSLLFILALGFLVPLEESWAQVHDLDFLLETVFQKKIPSSQSRESQRNPAETSKSLSYTRLKDGWRLVENHPPKEIRKVLLLPGLFGTEFLYHRMLKDPEAEKKGLHLIVGLAPGTGGQKAPASFNFSIPSYAELVETLAVEEKIDLIVGQGFMTEVLIEVALRKKFQGNFVLLTPALEPDDEPLAIRKLDLLSRNSRFKDLLWLGSNSFIENMLESYSPLQPEEQERLVSEARRSSMNDSQKILHGYFNQLRNPLRSILHLIPSLPEGKISLVFAGNDSTKLKPENRSLLLHSRKMKLIHLPRSSHWVTLDEWKTLNRILWP